MSIRSIIVNTFREAVRGRIFVVILAFSVVLLLAAKVLVPLSLGEEKKIIMDIGLSSISIFSILLAILIGSQLVFHEMEKKTIYFVMAKPVSRHTFILGKFLGLTITLLAVMAILTLWFYIVLFWLTRQHPFSILTAVFLSFLEAMIITALTIFFSTFASPVLTSIFTFFFFVIGRLAPDILLLAGKAKGVLSPIVLKGVYYVVPNLDNFNIRGKVVYAEPVSGSHILFSVAYALIYVVIVLAISCEIFGKKDL
jgi:ABC-type transport system involved in multi-copper enzyme maturation permease subunit